MTLEQGMETGEMILFCIKNVKSKQMNKICFQIFKLDCWKKLRLPYSIYRMKADKRDTVPYYSLDQSQWDIGKTP